jgi:hypothetical protein
MKGHVLCVEPVILLPGFREADGATGEQPIPTTRWLRRLCCKEADLHNGLDEPHKRGTLCP